MIVSNVNSNLYWQACELRAVSLSEFSSSLPGKYLVSSATVPVMYAWYQSLVDSLPRTHGIIGYVQRGHTSAPELLERAHLSFISRKSIPSALEECLLERSLPSLLAATTLPYAVARIGPARDAVCEVLSEALRAHASQLRLLQQSDQSYAEEEFAENIGVVSGRVCSLLASRLCCANPLWQI